MPLRHGVYYGARKERQWFRAMIYVYENGSYLWRETCGLPMTTRVDAIARAKWEAEYLAATNNPPPAVLPY
jgi:hypothetical protein